MKWENESLELVGIGLGSNLGGRMDNLRAARDELRALAHPAGPFLVAPVYRSAPVDCPSGSPDFLNTVIAFPFAGGPRDLLAAARAIESGLGRPGVRAVNAPRPIDLDILFFGGEVVAEPDLVIPHPRLAARRFVLQPLADILPGLVLPGETDSAIQHLARLGDSAPERLSLEAREW